MLYNINIPQSFSTFYRVMLNITHFNDEDILITILLFRIFYSNEIKLSPNITITKLIIVLLRRKNTFQLFYGIT